MGSLDASAMKSVRPPSPSIISGAFITILTKITF